MEPLKTAIKPKDPLFLSQGEISDFQKISSTKKYYISKENYLINMTTLL